MGGLPSRGGRVVRRAEYPAPVAETGRARRPGARLGALTRGTRKAARGTRQPRRRTVSRPRIVIVGAGFAGYRTARELARLTRDRADITLLNPTDYFLYLPLLPQVAAGVLEA